MIQLSAHTEQLVEEELKSGRFRSVDEIILQGIRARREAERRFDEAARHEAVDRALEFARYRPVRLNGISIEELLHEGHRV
jgi:Arc/MetJ-type ribon-helix-helix transcriptional regulator